MGYQRRVHGNIIVALLHHGGPKVNLTLSPRNKSKGQSKA